MAGTSIYEQTAAGIPTTSNSLLFGPRRRPIPPVRSQPIRTAMILPMLSS
jgi:hypothetical protein